jgi:hypothetical protein
VPRSESGRRGGTIPSALGDDDVELPCNVGYPVSECHLTFPQENPSRYELLSNVLVRRVVFMTGAIDGRNGCPLIVLKPFSSIECRQVSLVNMVTARKAFAFTVNDRADPAVQFLCREQSLVQKEVRYGDYVPARKI